MHDRSDKVEQEYEIGCGLEMLDDMDKDVATLLILDLPYYGVVDADWDNEWKSLDDYLDWCKEWFIKSERFGYRMFTQHELPTITKHIMDALVQRGYLEESMFNDILYYKLIEKDQG